MPFDTLVTRRDASFIVGHQYFPVMEREAKLVIAISAVCVVCAVAGWALMASQPADFKVTAQSITIDEDGHVVLHGDIMSNRGDEAIDIKISYTVYDDPTGRSYKGTYYVMDVPRLASEYWDVDTGVFATDPSQVRATMNYQVI